MTTSVDAYSRRRTCLTCGQLGEAGDARHPVPVLEPMKPPPAPPHEVARAWAARDAAILGEHDDDQEERS